MTPQEERELAELEALYTQAGGALPAAPSPSLLERVNSAASVTGIPDLAAGANRGITGLLDSAVGNPVAGLANSLGADIQRNPITRGLQSLGLGQERPDPNMAQRLLGRTGESVGAGVIPGLGMVSAAPRITSGLLSRPAAQVAANPTAFAGAELGASAAGGVGAGVAGEVAPGNQWAEMGGELAGSLAPAGLLGLARKGLGVQDDIAQSFQRAGVDPTIGQITTPNGIARGVESVSQSLPGGYGRFANAYERQAGQMQDSARRLGETLSPGAPSDATIGRTVRSGFEEFVKGRQKRASELWGKVDDALPADNVTEAATTRQVASELGGSGRAARGLMNPRTAQFVKTIEGAENLTVSELAGLRQQIGQKLGSPTLVDDMPRAELKRLYAAVSDDLREEARRMGVLKEFNRANTYTRSIHERTERVLDPILKRDVPEKVYQALIKSDASTMTNARRSLTPKQWQAVQAGVVNKIGTARPSSQTTAAADDFSAETFMTEWAKMEPRARTQLFSGVHGKAITDLATAAGQARANNQTLLNRSGTARLTAFTGTATAMGGAAMRGQPLVAGGIALGVGLNNVTARLWTSPRFVKWLSRAAKVPPERLPGMITRLQQGAARDDDPGIVADIQAYIEGLAQ